MLHLLVVHVDHLRHTIAVALRARRRGDTGALNTLELVVLGVGIFAIAGLFMAVVREVVTGRLDQLK